MGMPMTAKIRASVSTQRRSCRLLAPSDARRPNIFVRSATEMANEL